jgi:hypothetical protein
MTANGRERRPELVRDAHQEVALVRLRLGEALGHLPEALGQPADLVALAHGRKLDVVPSARDRVRRARQ